MTLVVAVPGQCAHRVADGLALKRRPVNFLLVKALLLFMTGLGAQPLAASGAAGRSEPAASASVSASADISLAIATAAGDLQVQQLDTRRLGQRFSVRLGGQVVLVTDQADEGSAFADFPVPQPLTGALGPFPGFAQVVVFQQFAWGNACNGGPLWVLAVRADGQFVRSAAVDYCGNAARPTVQADPHGVTISLPTTASGAAAVERWRFERGRLKRLGRPARRAS